MVKKGFNTKDKFGLLIVLRRNTAIFYQKNLRPQSWSLPTEILIIFCKGITLNNYFSTENFDEHLVVRWFLTDTQGLYNLKTRYSSI